MELHLVGKKHMVGRYIDGLICRIAEQIIEKRAD
jgi:hypothetical protein